MSEETGTSTLSTDHGGSLSPEQPNQATDADPTQTEPLKPLPIVGNLHHVTRDPLSFFDTARGHDLMPYRMFTDQCYVVSHPDGVQTVLVDNDEAYRKGEMMRKQIGSLLGDGIFLAESDDWQRQRTAMQPAFYRERITEYADSMVERSAMMVDRWNDGQMIDIAALSSQLTLEVLAETLLGIDPGSDRELVARAADAIADRYDSQRVGAFLPEWIPSPTNLRYRRAISDLRAMIDQVIQNRRRAIESGVDPGTDLLSMLIAATADGEMDDETLRDNVVTFLFAGHETTALGLTYALHSLATHPDEQDIAVDAIERFGDPVRKPGVAAERDALPAVDRVVNETLRLYPPVHVFFREPAHSVKLLGTQIPAGTVLALSPWTCHRDPRWWNEPETFRLDRWSTEMNVEDDKELVSESNRPEYAYFPFGGGPRHCIGMRFARLELRLTLAVFLSQYRFDPVTETLSFAPSATLQPDGPVRLQVRQRNDFTE